MATAVLPAPAVKVMLLPPAMAWPLSVNVTVPVGVGELLGEMVAVKVTVCPNSAGFCDEVTVMGSDATVVKLREMLPLALL